MLLCLVLASPPPASSHQHHQQLRQQTDTDNVCFGYRFLIVYAHGYIVYLDTLRRVIGVSVWRIL